MSRFVGDSEAVNFNSSLKSLESLGYDFDEGAHGAKLPLKEESGASTAGVGDLAEQLILDALEAIGKRDVQAVQEYEDARDARAERRRPRSTNIEISMEDFERYYTQQYNVLVERVPSAQERITSQEAHPLSDIKDTPEERISFGRVDHTPNSASDSTKSAISTEENWIGRLQEFFQGNPEYGWFTEETRELPDKKFTCVVTLPEFKVFFGKDSEGYSTKKEAKREACRAAMQHLYARGLTSSYISTREMRKKRNERTATKDPLIKSMRVQVNGGFLSAPVLQYR
jgi:hypothetical protein